MKSSAKGQPQIKLLPPAPLEENVSVWDEVNLKVPLTPGSCTSLAEGHLAS
jgi:hypothetical protein